MNSIHLISPYKHNGMWVFDDPAKELVREAFIAGADTVIDIATAAVPDADHGFNLLFADFLFPDYQLVLDILLDGTESGIGTDYICEQLGLKCWLCPALNKYYPISPDKIYASFLPIVGRTKRKQNTSYAKTKKERVSTGSSRRSRAVH